MSVIPSNPLGLKVWPRDLYAYKRYRSGAELIFVSRDSVVHTRNAARLGDIRVFVRRFSQMHLLVDREPYNMAKTTQEIINQNRTSHDPKTARGITDLYDTCAGSTAIVCGSGRSLLRDVPKIVEAKRDGANVKVFTINSAMRAFPEGVIDHHFMLDWSAKPEWWEGVNTDGIGLIISPAVPPVVQNNFKDIRYFSGPVPAADKSGAIECDKVGELEQCLHATYSLMH